MMMMMIRLFSDAPYTNWKTTLLTHYVYGLDNWGSKVRFLGMEAGNFSLHHRVQNGCGAHPT
jgi:hypothetical protein